MLVVVAVGGGWSVFMVWLILCAGHSALGDVELGTRFCVRRQTSKFAKANVEIHIQ